MILDYIKRKWLFLLIVNHIDPYDLIISHINKNGQSFFYNVSNKRDLKRKIRESYVDFSDYIFFEDVDKPEFKTLQ